MRRAHSWARRLGGSAARRLGGSAARRLGGSAARRLGGSAARRLGGSADIIDRALAAIVNPPSGLSCGECPRSAAAPSSMPYPPCSSLMTVSTRRRRPSAHGTHAGGDSHVSLSRYITCIPNAGPLCIRGSVGRRYRRRFSAPVRSRAHDARRHLLPVHSRPFEPMVAVFGAGDGRPIAPVPVERRSRVGLPVELGLDCLLPGARPPRREPRLHVRSDEPVRFRHLPHPPAFGRPSCRDGMMPLGQRLRRVARRLRLRRMRVACARRAVGVSSRTGPAGPVVTKVPVARLASPSPGRGAGECAARVGPSHGPGVGPASFALISPCRLTACRRLPGTAPPCDRAPPPAPASS